MLCLHIHARMQIGEVSDVQIEDHVYLTQARILYIPDFKIIEKGETIWEEMKGFRTAAFAMKRRLWKAGYGPGKLRIWEKHRKSITLVEEIIPQGSLCKTCGGPN